MQKKIALFFFDLTGLMAQPWLDAGYECWLFDGQHKEGVHRDGDLVRVGMMFDAYNTKRDLETIRMMIWGEVAFVFGFPECTDLAVSGNAHIAAKLRKNPACQAEAVELARFVSYVGELFGCPWGLENPVGVLATIWRAASHWFDPFNYAGYLPEDDIHPIYPNNVKPRDAYPKKTGIWCGNGFVMPPFKTIPLGEEADKNRQSKLGGRSLRTKNIRSATPRGFSKAVFIYNGVTQ